MHHIYHFVHRILNTCVVSCLTRYLTHLEHRRKSRFEPFHTGTELNNRDDVEKNGVALLRHRRCWMIDNHSNLQVNICNA